MMSPVTANRTRSPTVTAKRHSTTYVLSADNQKCARLHVFSRRWARGALAEVKYPGSCLSQALNVKKSSGFRGSDRSTGGTRTSSRNTPAATSQKTCHLAPTPTASPRAARISALDSPRTTTELYGAQLARVTPVAFA